MVWGEGPEYSVAYLRRRRIRIVPRPMRPRPARPSMPGSGTCVPLLVLVDPPEDEEVVLGGQSGPPEVELLRSPEVVPPAKAGLAMPRQPMATAMIADLRSISNSPMAKMVTANIRKGCANRSEAGDTVVNGPPVQARL